MLELELKAVVPDAALLRAALARHGSVRFSGRLLDRRLDQGGALVARDEVLRIRRHEGHDGSVREELGWKGPVHRSAEGYKARRELEIGLTDGAPAGELLAALGYQVIHAIDRWVEVWDVGGGTARIEWYPDLDVLLEVEGDPAAIEQIIALTGIAREQFSADALVDFVRRFEIRTGRPARVALDSPDEQPPHWPAE
ncbi:MAG: hypothetical protein U0974_06400 [Gemmatimonadales bacterium]|nr:hypothetical protein [Gemmatimonadales bacterium]MDZ4389343.1 hypothetical protein [Gemmatimonadales bacterium]